MKKATLAVLTIVSAASMASIASAVPFGANNLPPGLNGGGPSGLNGGGPPGLNGGGPPGLNSGGPPGLNGGGSGVNPLVIAATPNTQVVGVPEGGTSLLLLGAGLLGIVLWRRRWQQRFY